MAGWDDRQIKDFVRAVRAETRDGWEWLTPRVQRALIAEKAFAVVRGQARDTVEVKAMDELLFAMLRVAGLEGE